MSKLYIIIISTLLILPNLSCQNKEQINSITEQSVKAQMDFLANDILEGREAGKTGSRIAAEYIVSQLKEYGIHPFFRESYYQAFETDRYRDPFTRQNENMPILKLRNIAGYIPGKLNDEFTIVGAHYDHLGIGPAIDNDSIYNGADDNASGIIAVLQLAKAFALNGEQPLRTIIFAFWDGEEKGLLGSTYFVENFLRTETIKGYMNFDMIGRNNKEEQPEHFVYLYTEAYPKFEKWLDKAISSYDLNLLPEYKAWAYPASGSDNAPFAKKQIPVAWFHTDAHPDFHKPGDEAQKINYDKMIDIIRASYYVFYKFANQKALN